VLELPSGWVWKRWLAPPCAVWLKEPLQASLHQLSVPPCAVGSTGNMVGNSRPGHGQDANLRIQELIRSYRWTESHLTKACYQTLSSEFRMRCVLRWHIPVCLSDPPVRVWSRYLWAWIAGIWGCLVHSASFPLSSTTSIWRRQGEHSDAVKWRGGRSLSIAQQEETDIYF